LTSPGSRLESVETGSSTLIGYRSDLGDQREVLLENTDPTALAKVSASWFIRSSKLEEETYSAATAGESTPIVQTTTTSGNMLSLPPLSIVVLSGTPRT
jgi:hypothetical protein